MNAIDLLKQDHDAVDALFVRCESTPPSKHEATIKRIKGELETHAHLEEKIFYPACRQRGDEELQKLVAEALEEHAQMKKFLREMTRSTSTDKREAKLKVLIEDTRHHVKEEENEMFPMVEGQFPAEELEKLGERMEAEKKKFQKAKRITPRRAPEKGMVAMMLDKAKEMVAAVTASGTNQGADKGGSRSSKAGRGNGSRSGKSSSKSANGKGSSSTSGSRSAKAAKKSTGSGNTSSSKAKAASPKKSGSKGSASRSRSSASR